MQPLRALLAVFLVTGLLGCGGTTTTGTGTTPAPKPPTTQEKLVGTWEITKGAPPPGSTIEFTKDGKMKMTAKGPDGKAIIMEGTYKVDGDAIKSIYKDPGGKEVKETNKIKTLTDKELVTTDEQGKQDAFKKK